jgi:hypothetical protein
MNYVIKIGYVFYVGLKLATKTISSTFKIEIGETR